METIKEVVLKDEQRLVNGSKAEAVAGTLAYLAIEVPGAAGAKSVQMYDAFIVTGIPDIVAGLSRSQAVLCIGEKVPTAVDLSQRDAVAAYDIAIVGSAPGTPEASIVFNTGRLGMPVMIPKDPSSGKYYVTVAVKGAGSVTLQVAYYHMRFMVTF